MQRLLPRDLTFLRWPLLLTSLLLILLIGWFRERYILNFLGNELPLLIPRNGPDLSKYPLSVSSFADSLLSDPRWFTTLILNGIMMLSTAAVIGLWFRKKAYFWIVLFGYAFLSIFCGLLIGISILFDNYAIGYGVAQQLKNLLQLPFLLILLIPAFMLYEKKEPA